MVLIFYVIICMPSPPTMGSNSHYVFQSCVRLSVCPSVARTLTPVLCVVITLSTLEGFFNDTFHKLSVCEWAFRIFKVRSQRSIDGSPGQEYFTYDAISLYLMARVVIL